MVLLKLVKMKTTAKLGNFVDFFISESTLNLKVCLLFRCLSRLIYRMAFDSHKKRLMWKIKTAQGTPYDSTAAAQTLSSPAIIYN